MRNRSIPLTLLVGFSLFLPSIAFAQDASAPNATATSSQTTPAAIDPVKEKSIREMLTLLDTSKAFQIMLRRMITQMRPMMPNIPAEFWDRFSAKFENVDEVVNEAVRLYDKRFTKEDIDGLIAFYKTPLGQKFIKESAGIQQDISDFGQQWGQQKGREVAQEMTAAKAAASPAKPFDKRPFQSSGNVVKTASGLQYDDMTVGKGAVATKGKTAVVHYTGTLKDGTKFDSSRDRGEAFEFALGAGQVIPGWDEGVAGMKVGGRRKLILPAKLGYGERGTPGGPIPPNAILIFDVELMDLR